jgi:hypothetical protein
MTSSGTTTDPKAPSRSPLRRGAAVVGVILALSMGVGAIVGTSQGLTIGPRDTPSYLSSAENLAAGLGYRTPYGDPGKPIDFEETTSPVVDFPPGYPAVLSLGVRMGADSRSTARVISALLVAAITLSLNVASRALPLFRSGVAGAALVALIAGALTLPFTTSALSEPLYGLLLILTLAAATSYARDKQLLPLVLATLLAASATTVRTSGLALVATVMIVAWLSIRGVKRWFVPLAVGLVGVGPFYLSTALGNRVLAWHPPEIGSAKEFLNGVAEWFIPPIGSPTFMVVAFAALVVGLLAWVRPWRGRMARVRDDSSFPPLWSVALIAAGAHLGLLFVTKFLFSAQLSLGTRQLYPVGISLLFAVVQFLGHRPETGGKRMTHGFVLLGLCSLLATGWVAAVTLDAVVSGMRGFNSDGFLKSETVEYVVGSVPGDQVFGNAPDGLWVAGLANTRPLPIVYDPLSLEDNAAMDEEMSRLTDSIGNGAVLFYQFDGRDYMVELSDLRAIAPCVVVADSTAIVLAGADHARCAGT